MEALKFLTDKGKRSYNKAYWLPSTWLSDPNPKGWLSTAKDLKEVAFFAVINEEIIFRAKFRDKLCLVRIFDGTETEDDALRYVSIFHMLGDMEIGKYQDKSDRKASYFVAAGKMNPALKVNDIFIRPLRNMTRNTEARKAAIKLSQQKYNGDGDTLFVIIEELPFGFKFQTLTQMVNNSKTKAFTASALRKMSFQLIMDLYLLQQERGFVHNDIQPDYILVHQLTKKQAQRLKSLSYVISGQLYQVPLVGGDYVVHYSGFHASRIGDDEYGSKLLENMAATSSLYTQEYLAFESLRATESLLEKRSFASDMYSLGLVILGLATFDSYTINKSKFRFRFDDADVMDKDMSGAFITYQPRDQPDKTPIPRSDEFASYSIDQRKLAVRELMLQNGILLTELDDFGPDDFQLWTRRKIPNLVFPLIYANLVNGPLGDAGTSMLNKLLRVNPMRRLNMFSSLPLGLFATIHHTYFLSFYKGYDLAGITFEPSIQFAELGKGLTDRKLKEIIDFYNIFWDYLSKESNYATGKVAVSELEKGKEEEEEEEEEEEDEWLTYQKTLPEDESDEEEKEEPVRLVKREKEEKEEEEESDYEEEEKVLVADNPQRQRQLQRVADLGNRLYNLFFASQRIVLKRKLTSAPFKDTLQVLYELATFVDSELDDPTKQALSLLWSNEGQVWQNKHPYESIFIGTPTPQYYKTKERTAQALKRLTQQGYDASEFVSGTGKNKEIDNQYLAAKMAIVLLFMEAIRRAINDPTIKTAASDLKANRKAAKNIYFDVADPAEQADAYRQLLQPLNIATLVVASPLQTISNQLETIEHSPLLRADGYYKERAIADSLLGPLKDKALILQAQIPDQLQSSIDQLGLASEQESMADIVEQMPPQIQTRYFHTLSLVAQMLHRIEQHQPLDESLVERCQAEWPEIMYQRYIKL